MITNYNYYHIKQIVVNSIYDYKYIELLFIVKIIDILITRRIFNNNNFIRYIIINTKDEYNKYIEIIFILKSIIKLLNIIYQYT
jgi:hypothetical protein